MSHVHAQSASSAAPCAASSTSDSDRPTGPEVSIAEVIFLGSLRMPVSDQQQIAESVKQKASGGPFDGVTQEALERVRLGWQDHGYFSVQVTGEPRVLTSNSASQLIALSVYVDEGSRYTLGGITFKNNKAISNVDTLRGLFPIADGEIFNREKIATGIENLLKAYGELGYLNFIPLPDTNVDDEDGRISVEIDFDEGKQFHVGSVNVLGADSDREQILKTLHVKRGQIYTSRLWEESLLMYSSKIPDCDCRQFETRHFEEKSGIVTLTLDFRPCPPD
jgi:outer membrane protein assembly factor BamA